MRFLFKKPLVVFPALRAHPPLFVNASMVHEREGEREGAAQTEGFCFQIRLCTLPAKTNCCCEKCDMKSPPRRCHCAAECAFTS